MPVSGCSFKSGVFTNQTLQAMKRKEKFSELYGAALDGDFCKVRSLIQAGANLNCQESTCRLTPLFGAIVSANIQMIEELIRAGADVNIRIVGDMMPLITAVETGKVKVVKTLLDNGANIHATYFTGETALHMAAELGYTKIAKLLVERGLDLDICNELDETPLHVAVQAGHINTVKLFLDKKADINAVCSPEKAEVDGIELGSNATSVFLAAYWGHWDILDMLIESGADVTIKTSYNHTALHFAVQQEAPVATVNALLKGGSDVNVRSNYMGLTPLLLAAKAGNVGIIQALLNAKGVDVNPIPSGMETPLSVAAYNGHLEIAKLLVANGASVNVEYVTPLHMALIGKKEKVAEFLIQNGADCSAVDTLGTTPLHSACQKNASLKIIKALVEKGADVNARVFGDRKTPLHYVVGNDNVEIVQFLVDHGADLRIVDADNWTVLHQAADCGCVKVVDYLVKKVSEIDPQSNCLTTPLHQAVYKGHKEVVVILLNNGASVNKQDKTKCTPLHIALKERKCEIAELLLKHNIEVNLRERQEGCTYLFLAVKNKYEKLVCLLLDKGADANAANKFGIFPIHIASKLGSFVMVEALLMKGAYYDMEVKTTNFSGSPLKFAQKAANTKVISMLELIEKLFDAVITNNIYQMVSCIKAGVLADIKPAAILNAKNKDERTALHYAVSKANVDMVKTLLANGTDITITTSKEDSPLNIAITNNCTEIAEILLAHTKNLSFIKSNCVVNMKAVKNGMTALHIAAEKGMSHIVKLLLGSGAVYDVRNKSIKTPLQLTTDEAVKNLLISTKKLFEALKAGDVLEKITQIVEDNNAVVNARDSDGGGTPLYWSVSKGKTDIANVLLSNGADCCLVTHKGSTPLHIAASKGYAEIVKILINRVKNHNAIKLNDFINATTMGGTTALHVASSLEVVKCLLQAGAIYDIQNNRGKTPLESTWNDDVRKLLKTTHELFRDVKKNISSVVDVVNGLGTDEFKAVLSTRNELGQTLPQVALANYHIKTGSKWLDKLKKLG